MAALWWRGRGTVIHTVEADSQWPHPVSEIAGLLQVHLLNWLKDTSSIPYVSPFAVHLLPELQSFHDDADSNFSVFPPAEKLPSLLNTIMSTCATLRSIVEDERKYSYDPNPKVALLIPLIRTIMNAAFPMACIEECVRCISPKPSTPSLNSLLRITSTSSFALLLAVYRAHECDISAVSFSVSDRDGDECIETTVSVSPAPSPRRLTMSEFCGARRSDSETQDSIDPGEGDSDSCAPVDGSDDRDAFIAAVIDPVLQAHILETASSTDTPAVSLLCAGYLDDIFGLMASSLYQRLTLGISEPIVGLAFTHTGTQIQVLFGWLDIDTADRSDLPDVHIAFARTDSNCDSPCSTGIFDICNIHSAVLFAEFLASLDHHLYRIVSSIRVDAVARLEATSSEDSRLWRSDSIGVDCFYDNKKVDISTWGRDVADSCLRPSVIRSADMSGQHPLPNNNRQQPPWRTEHKAGTATAGGDTSGLRSWEVPQTSSRSVNSGNAGIPGSLRRNPSLQVLSTESQSLNQLSIKHLSCSKFAAGAHMKDGPKDSAVHDWLSLRSAVTTHFPLDSAVEDINQPYMSFHWPAQWTSPKSMPPVDADLETLRNMLFDNFTARKEHVKSGRVPAECDLPADILSMIAPKLSVILRASQNARKKRAEAQLNGVPEAEWRLDWDELFFQFMSCVFVGSESRPMLERTLNLSRDTAYDRENDKKYNHLREHLLRHHFIKCAEYRDAIRSAIHNLGDSDPALLAELERREAQAQAGFDLAVANLARFGKLVPSEFAKIEAMTGKCDALGIIRIHSVFRDSVPDQRFPLICPLSSPPSALSAPASATKSDIGRDIDVNAASDLFLGARDESRLEGCGASGVSPRPTSGNVDPMATLSQQLSQTRLDDQSPSASGTKSAIELPLFMAEYKKNLTKFSVAESGVGQCRMYLASAVKFLETLGITDFPVYGLTTEGPVGIIMAAHLTSIQPSNSGERLKITEIFERNACAYDISTPLGAFNYATFLSMLARCHAETLKARFGGVKDSFLKCLAVDDPSIQWSMKYQFPK